MAMFPCDFDGLRYRGPQQTIYPAVVDGGSSARRKLRLCPAHFDLLLQRLETHSNNAQIGYGEAATVGCLACGKHDSDSPFQFFATVYAHRQDRADWWSPVCAACVTAVLTDWRLPTDIDVEAP